MGAEADRILNRLETFSDDFLEQLGVTKTEIAKEVKGLRGSCDLLTESVNGISEKVNDHEARITKDESDIESIQRTMGRRAGDGVTVPWPKIIIQAVVVGLIVSAVVLLCTQDFLIAGMSGVVSMAIKPFYVWFTGV